MTGERDGRRRGALLGLAVGDALGAAAEFKPPDTFPPVVGYRAGGPHGLGPGEWTDDTSMALALADSIATVGWDLDDQAARYVAWFRRGEYSVNGRCFDIGGATRAGLMRYEQTRDAATAGGDHERSAGNGSIMRLAPVPIAYADWYPHRTAELIRRAADSSLPTHRVSQATSACGYMGLLLAALMAGEPLDVVLAPDWPQLDVLRATLDVHPEVDRVIAGSFRDREPPEIRGTGYVVDCLEASLWALTRHRGFEAIVLAAVNLGDDADTTGAVAGQLAGAHWGLDPIRGIPRRLLDGLAKRDLIETAAQRLVDARAGGLSSPSPGDGKPKINSRRCSLVRMPAGVQLDRLASALDIFSDVMDGQRPGNRAARPDGDRHHARSGHGALHRPSPNGYQSLCRTLRSMRIA